MGRFLEGIYFKDDGMSTSIRGMHLQSTMLGTISDNIKNFGKVGARRKENVVSSFSEYVGTHALSVMEDDKPGRIRLTENQLDFALEDKGYFQILTKNGIELTRDGRFHIDKNGYLKNLLDNSVMDKNGMPIKFKEIPSDLNMVRVEKDGSIWVVNPETKEENQVGEIARANTSGAYSSDIKVRQKYVEDSNISLQKEFMDVVPVRRNFEANRQLYLIQQDALDKALRQLASG